MNDATEEGRGKICPLVQPPGWGVKTEHAHMHFSPFTYSNQHLQDMSAFHVDHSAQEPDILARSTERPSKRRRFSASLSSLSASSLSATSATISGFGTVVSDAGTLLTALSEDTQASISAMSVAQSAYDGDDEDDHGK